MLPSSGTVAGLGETPLPLSAASAVALLAPEAPPAEPPGLADLLYMAWLPVSSCCVPIHRQVPQQRTQADTTTGTVRNGEALPWQRFGQRTVAGVDPQRALLLSRRIRRSASRESRMSRSSPASGASTTRTVATR